MTEKSNPDVVVSPLLSSEQLSAPEVCAVVQRARGSGKEQGIQALRGGGEKEKEARKKTKTLTREGAPLLHGLKPSKLLFFIFG